MPSWMRAWSTTIKHLNFNRRSDTSRKPKHISALGIASIIVHRHLRKKI